jgi:hypothetical protein
MDNPVVRTVEAALLQSDFATLRFNFRGTGRSTGAYGGGIGEQDDVRAAVAYLQEHSGVSFVTVTGYSFGAMVALQAGANLASVDRLIAVATPLAFIDLAFLAACRKPKLFIVGDRDQYCSIDELTRQLVNVPDPKTQCILAGADHFFYGQESAITAAITTFVGP